ncbi:MAG: glycosyltransferase [Saprospiraceae bacterium]|nr:glycosyltransferase [Saprospiraceae bacterium]
MRNPRAFRMENQIRSLHPNRDYLVISSKCEKGEVKDEKNIYRIGFKRNQKSPLRQQLKRYSLLRFFHKFIWPDDKVFFALLSLVYYILFLRKRDDHIYTVSHPFSIHLVGYYLKKIHKQVWTADIGDLFYLPHQKAHPFKKWNPHFEQKVLSTCDHIRVNANSMRNYFAEKYHLDYAKFEVLPNGNRLDFSTLKRPTSGTLQLTFIGNTYEGIRDGLAEIDLFINLYTQFPEMQFNLQLLGMMYSPLLQKIRPHSSWIQTGICDSDEKLLAAYSTTHILLNFANKNYPGIPSKLDEYVASGIPVIHFCWEANDPGSIYLQEQKHPYLEFVIMKSAIVELERFLKSISV